MIALFLGTALAVTSLLYVLYPLFRAQPARVAPDARGVIAPISALDALRELEFDRQTGKISASDYESLKARYTDQAVAVMRAGNAAVCETCGPRPESDARFCSNCGSVLVA
jgi:ribosomal protein L40E